MQRYPSAGNGRALAAFFGVLADGESTPAQEWGAGPRNTALQWVWGQGDDHNDIIHL